MGDQDCIIHVYKHIIIYIYLKKKAKRKKEKIEKGLMKIVIFFCCIIGFKKLVLYF